MKVFISWSGPRSRALALSLRAWLPDVVHALDPWMSHEDIEAGARWSPELSRHLAETKAGIICLTPENLSSPWLQFEAGALAKTIDEDTRVIPYLLDLEAADVPQGNPLTQFQAKKSDHEGTSALLSTLNRALGEHALEDAQLSRAFEKWWNDLEAKINEAKATNPEGAVPAERNVREVLSDILSTVRSLDAQRRSENARHQSLGETKRSSMSVEAEEVAPEEMFDAMRAYSSDPPHLNPSETDEEAGADDSSDEE